MKCDLLQTPTSRGKPKSSSSDIRIQMSHIFRLMAGKLKPGTLTSSKPIRNRFLDFITDSLKFISNVNSGGSHAHSYSPPCQTLLISLAFAKKKAFPCTGSTARLISSCMQC